MHNIDLSKPSEFNHAMLSKESISKLEFEIQRNTAADASLPALSQEYPTQHEIDAIIGEDDEECTYGINTENFVEEKCKKDDISASVVANIKIQQSMNNMKVTNEEMAKVAERCNVINAAHESTKTLTENLVNAYSAEHPELTNEEAVEVVSRLIRGCDCLTRKYNQAVREGFDSETEIKRLTKGMDTETRFNYLVNALAAVDALNSRTVQSQKDADETVKDYIEKYTSLTPHPTETDCEDIQRILTEAIANNSLLLTSMEQAQELLASAKDTNSVIDFTSDQYDDARTKAEMALAMWIEYENGNIPSIAKGATPESIGIGAATAVEEAKIINDIATGRKSADIAVKCLKILGGVALFLLLGYLGMIVAATVGGFAAAALMSVFGTSTIACIATMAICLPLIWGMAQLLVRTGSFIMDKAGIAFDYVVCKLRESVFPKIKSITSRIIAWFKSKLGGRSTSAATTVAMA